MLDVTALGTELGQQAGEILEPILYEDTCQPGRPIFYAATSAQGSTGTSADIAYQSAATAGITPREGGNVLWFRCREDDGGTRSEVSLNDGYGAMAGGYYSDLGIAAAERWSGFSIYIKSSEYDTWTSTFGFVLFQLHGPGSTTPPTYMKLDTGSLDLEYARRYENPTDGYTNITADLGVDLTLDAWNDFVMHHVIDPYGGNGGLLQIWHRVAGNAWPGSPQVDLSGIKLGYFDDAQGTDPCYWKHGIYALGWDGTTNGQIAVVYEDCVRIADHRGSFAAVAPGRSD